MDVAAAPRASSWLDHLPAVFREAPAGEEPFLGRFLLAFEHLLAGVGSDAEPGLDERVSGVPAYLDPAITPAPFLDWLAGWVGLALRADLDAGMEDTGDGDGRPRARALVADAVSLYAQRGTPAGIARLVARIAGAEPTLTEPAAALQLGVASRIGLDTRVEGGPPYRYQVTLRLATPDPAARARLEALVRAVLDVETPAHTRYQLDVVTPAMQLGVHARIALDTLLTPAASPGA